MFKCTQPSMASDQSIDDQIKVTPETYIRAESNRQFREISKMAGGINCFNHFRSPTPLNRQNVVRMNRDTLYSMAIFSTLPM
jgi:hypothetical protein